MRLFWHFREYHYITCDFYKNHHYCIYLYIYIYTLFQICFAVLPIFSGQWKLWLDMFQQQMSISKTYNRDFQQNIIIQPAPQGKIPEIGSQEPHKSSQKSQILCRIQVGGRKAKHRIVHDSRKPMARLNTWKWTPGKKRIPNLETIILGGQSVTT